MTNITSGASCDGNNLILGGEKDFVITLLSHFIRLFKKIFFNLPKTKQLPALVVLPPQPPLKSKISFELKFPVFFSQRKLKHIESEVHSASSHFSIVAINVSILS